MNSKIEILEWNQLWHLQQNGAPIITPNRNILSFKNKGVLERLLLETDWSNSHLYKVLSQIVDQNTNTFDQLWSSANYFILASQDNSFLVSNIPSYIDFLNVNGLLIGEDTNLKNRYQFDFSKLYKDLVIERKVILEEFVKEGFDVCFCLIFLHNHCNLSELIENQMFLQKLRFGDSENYFLKKLSSKFKCLIEVLNLI